jgi:hypothetical protein
LQASGFRIPALPADLTAVRPGLVQDPFSVHHGENGAIRFANGISSLHRSVKSGKDCVGFIQLYNRIQVMAVERVLKASVQSFWRLGYVYPRMARAYMRRWAHDISAFAKHFRLLSCLAKDPSRISFVGALFSIIFGVTES